MTAESAAVTARPRIVVLLTATIDVRGVAFMERRDPTIRLNDYKNALKAWLTNPQCPSVVFAENSGYPLDELEAIRLANASSGRTVEFLSFDDNNYPRGLGKGFGELRTIRYALAHSKVIDQETLVIKVTGRHYVHNIGDLLACGRDAWKVDIFCDLRGGLTWADTRLFCATVPFINDYFLPMEESVDDTAGITIEHVLARAVHLAMSRGRRWSMFPVSPQIRGVSGTSDVTYSDSFLTRKKQELFRRIKTAVLER